MVSKIKTDVIETSLGKPVDLTGQNASKAWVNYDAVLPTVRDSLNISSLADLGTGNFKHNHTNSMANGNYSLSVTWAYQDADVGSGAFYYNYAPGQRMAMTPVYSHINQFGSTDSGTSGDSLYVCIVNHGDLA